MFTIFSNANENPTTTGLTVIQTASCNTVPCDNRNVVMSS